MQITEKWVKSLVEVTVGENSTNDGKKNGRRESSDEPNLRGRSRGRRDERNHKKINR